MEQTRLALSLRNIVFRWPGQRDFRLEIETFSVAAGESVLLLGASGSGKSTLLGLISGTVLPQAGQVEVNGHNMTGVSSAQRDALRGEHIGVIFQQFNLLPHARVLDNVLLALRFARHRRAAVAEPRQSARQLLSALGLPDDIASRRAGTLSIGQQQRVAAARALIGAPSLILADEPTSALDRDNQDRFIELVFAVARRQASSLVMVSHNAELGRHFDRVVHMDALCAGVEKSPC